MCRNSNSVKSTCFFCLCRSLESTLLNLFNDIFESIKHVEKLFGVKIYHHFQKSCHRFDRVHWSVHCTHKMLYKIGIGCYLEFIEIFKVFFLRNSLFMVFRRNKTKKEHWKSKTKSVKWDNVLRIVAIVSIIGMLF